MLVFGVVPTIQVCSLFFQDFHFECRADPDPPRADSYLDRTHKGFPSNVFWSNFSPLNLILARQEKMLSKSD